MYGGLHELLHYHSQLRHWVWWSAFCPETLQWTCGKGEKEDWIDERKFYEPPSIAELLK